MHQYLTDLTNVIINCSFDNTYKMAWAKSIVDLASEINYREVEEEVIEIDFNNIARKFVHYYWNQTIYFDLFQGSNLNKQPEILTITKNLIEEYYKNEGDRRPQNYIKVFPFGNDTLMQKYNKAIRRIVSVLKQDVCWRFKKLNGNEVELYELDRSEGKLYICKEHCILIKEHNLLLLQAINYKWSQMLDSFNRAPRISTKVNVANDNQEIKRQNLKKYRKYLDLEFDSSEIKCFYCGNVISLNEVSIDHVIPWSFMYSDDLWNLVYCHKSENSSKQAILVEEEIISRLEERNIKLLTRIDEMGMDNKVFQELKLANEKSWLKQFWLAYKG